MQPQDPHSTGQTSIVLCYAHGCRPDEDLVRELYAALAPEFALQLLELRDGHDVVEEMSAAIAAADAFIVLLSRGGLQHPAAASAIDEALRHPQMAMIPVRVAYDGPLPTALDRLGDRIPRISWRNDRDTPSLIGQIKRALPRAGATAAGMLDPREQFLFAAASAESGQDALVGRSTTLAMPNPARVVVALTLAADFADFDPDVVPRLLEGLGRIIDRPASALRHVGFDYGSVVVLIEMDEDSARGLLERYLRRDAALSQLGITRLEYRLPTDDMRGGETRSGSAVAEPVQILFLAANPRHTRPLELDREVRNIQEVLRAVDLRHRFELKQEWAVRLDDLRRCLLQYKPAIVHFSGHGTKAGELLFADDGVAPSARPVEPASLSGLFRILGGDVRFVILNACFSEPQAVAIARHVPCVVGMSGQIDDDNSLAFSGALYQALGYGKDLHTAFELGCHAIDSQGRSPQLVPRLLRQDGCDPGSIVLAR